MPKGNDGTTRRDRTAREIACPSIKATTGCEPLESRLLFSTYYVSPAGNDAANGLSTSAAFKTIARVNKLDLNPGDKVLFQGGATFATPVGSGSSKVFNADFSQGTTGWPTASSTSETSSKVVNGVLTFDQLKSVRQQDITSRVKPNQAYTLSVKSMTNNPFVGNGTAGVDFYLNGTRIRGVFLSLKDVNSFKTMSRTFSTPPKFDKVVVWVRKDAGASKLQVDSVDVREASTPLTLTAEDAGTSSNPVTISSYGTGRAIINGGDGGGMMALNVPGLAVNNIDFKGNWKGGAGVGTNAGVGMEFMSTLAGNAKNRYVRVSNVDVSGFKWGGALFESGLLESGFADVKVTGVIAHENGDVGIQFVRPVDHDTPYAYQDVYIGYCKAYNNGGLPEKNGVTGNGILLEDTDRGVIERSTATNNGFYNYSFGGGPGGIWTTNSNAVTIQYCESYANKSSSDKDGSGFDLDGGTTNSVIQYCYSHDNYGAGFQVAHYPNARPKWGNNILRYNVSENDGRVNYFGGIHVSGVGVVDGLKIYNNVIFKSPSVGFSRAAVRIKQPGGAVQFRNNIIMTTGGVPLIELLEGNGVGLSFEGNDYWSSGAPFSIIWNGNHSSLASWRAATSQEKLGKAKNVDPKLNNPGHGGTIGDPSKLTSLWAYQLKSGSPLTGVGLDMGFTGKDFFGHAVPVGHPSIGASEPA